MIRQNNINNNDDDDGDDDDNNINNNDGDNSNNNNTLLSPPNEVSEGTMKRAPYVCVCVRASTKNATSPLFLGRF